MVLWRTFLSEVSMFLQPLFLRRSPSKMMYVANLYFVDGRYMPLIENTMISFSKLMFFSLDMISGIFHIHLSKKVMSDKRESIKVLRFVHAEMKKLFCLSAKAIISKFFAIFTQSYFQFPPLHPLLFYTFQIIFLQSIGCSF